VAATVPAGEAQGGHFGSKLPDAHRAWSPEILGPGVGFQGGLSISANQIKRSQAQGQS